jgi:predicted DNA-binding WGR domain protein
VGVGGAGGIGGNDDGDGGGHCPTGPAKKGRCETVESGRSVSTVEVAFAEGEALRRFEFVGGSSAKFWEADVEGASFVVTFGRLGAAGQRKAKAFATEAEARRECEKKIAEKLREGYREVGAGGAPAAAAPAGPAWPERRVTSAPSPAHVAEAVGALGALGAALGRRSWVVGRAVRRAGRALEPLGGLPPEASGAFTTALDAVIGRVTSARGRLPLADALSLLGRLDVRFFRRALGLWGAGAGRDAAAVAWLGAQAEALGDDEAALRVGLLATDRGRHPAGWRRRREALWPPLAEHLGARGATVVGWVGALDAGGDAALGARLRRLAAGG